MLLARGAICFDWYSPLSILSFSLKPEPPLLFFFPDGRQAGLVPSNDPSTRQGVALGLAEVLKCATRRQIEDFLDDVIDTVSALTYGEGLLWVGLRGVSGRFLIGSGVYWVVAQRCVLGLVYVSVDAIVSIFAVLAL